MTRDRTGCETNRERMTELLYGELDVRSLQELSSHLETCEDCREELESLRSIRSLMRSARTIDIPPGLEARVMSEARSALSHRATPYVEPSGPRATQASWLSRLLKGGILRPAMAAALAVLLVAGVAYLLEGGKPSVMQRYEKTPSPAPSLERAAPAPPAPATEHEQSSTHDHKAVTPREDPGLETTVTLAQQADVAMTPTGNAAAEKVVADNLSSSQVATKMPAQPSAEADDEDAAGLVGAKDSADTGSASPLAGKQDLFAAIADKKLPVTESMDEAAGEMPAGGMSTSSTPEGGHSKSAGGTGAKTAMTGADVGYAPEPVAPKTVAAPPAKLAPPPSTAPAPSPPASAGASMAPMDGVESGMKSGEDTMSEPEPVKDVEEATPKKKPSLWESWKKKKAEKKEKKKGSLGTSSSSTGSTEAEKPVEATDQTVFQDPFDQAMGLKKDKKCDEAIPILKKLKDDPASTQASQAKVYHTLAECTAAQGEAQKALVYYENLFARWPAYAGRNQAMWEAAQLYILVGDKATARAMLEKLLSVPAFSDKAKKKLEGL